MSKIVLITGASSGLGLNMAEYLSSKGYIVYGTSRNETHHDFFSFLKIDVTNEESIHYAINEILKKHNRIDILINNAGLGIAGPIEYLSMNDITNVINTNLIGVIKMCQAVIPHMRNVKSGKIINISSIASEAGLPYRGLYSATKAAVDRLTETIRIELAPYGIQACYIQPGGFQTDINKNRIKTSLPDDAVYKKSFENTYQLIDESVLNGLNPKVFAPLIEKIILSNSIKRCYRIGKPIEKLSVILKHILPSAMYDKMMRKHYGI